MFLWCVAVTIWFFKVDENRCKFGCSELVGVSNTRYHKFKPLLYVYFSPERLFLQPNCSLNSIPIEVIFLAWARRTLRPVAEMLRNQLQAWILHLSASPTEGLNSSAQLFCLTKTDEQKIVEKLQILANMQLICRGRQKSLGLWDGVAQFHLMNVNKSAGRITGLHSSVSASFRFTRQSIHCIGQAGLRVGRFACLASKPAGEQTGQNMYILAKSAPSSSWFFIYPNHQSQILSYVAISLTACCTQWDALRPAIWPQQVLNSGRN